MGYKGNATRMLAGRRYMMMEGVEGVVSRGGGEYLTKLTLSRATPAAAGVYVCLAVNDLGFSFKKAHLTVRRQPGEGGGGEGEGERESGGEGRREGRKMRIRGRESQRDGEAR